MKRGPQPVCTSGMRMPDRMPYLHFMFHSSTSGCSTLGQHAHETRSRENVKPDSKPGQTVHVAHPTNRTIMNQLTRGCLRWRTVARMPSWLTEPSFFHELSRQYMAERLPNGARAGFIRVLECARASSRAVVVKLSVPKDEANEPTGSEC
uniref:Uncharacterized protein n=1 Tax=Anopheles culicifacies TaxID=139723 RepID=A0A182MHP8_9DIPT